jgi:hypothetical protein
MLLDYFRINKEELTAKQVSCVPCPTCRVAARRRCVLQLGALRSEPHMDRKLSAIEVIETNLGRKENSRKLA